MCAPWETGPSGSDLILTYVRRGAGITTNSDPWPGRTDSLTRTKQWSKADLSLCAAWPTPSARYAPQRNGGRAILLSALGLGNVVKLERQLQVPFDDARSAQPEHTGTGADANSALRSVVRAVQRARLAAQRTAEQATRGGWEVEIGEVEQVVGRDARLDRQTLVEFVHPAEFEVEGSQTVEGNLILGRGRNEARHASQRAQLLDGKEPILNEHLSGRSRLIGIDRKSV